MQEDFTALGAAEYLSIYVAILAIMMIGAAIGALTWRRPGRLERAPFFAFTGMVMLAISLSDLAWLGVDEATSPALFLAILLAQVLTLIAGGYAIYAAAVARAEDCYGNRRMAWLAFIPVANLVLLFKSSRPHPAERRLITSSWLTGNAGVAVGLVAYIAGNLLSDWVDERMATPMVAATAPVADETVEARLLISEEGLSDALDILAEEFAEPVFLDEFTVLADIERDGETLRYFYVLATEVDGPVELAVEEVRAYFCDSPLFPVLEAGGEIAAAYFTTQETFLGEVRVTEADCGV